MFLYCLSHYFLFTLCQQHRDCTQVIICESQFPFIYSLHFSDNTDLQSNVSSPSPFHVCYHFFLFSLFSNFHERQLASMSQAYLQNPLIISVFYLLFNFSNLASFRCQINRMCSSTTILFTIIYYHIKHIPLKIRNYKSGRGGEKEII